MIYASVDDGKLTVRGHDKTKRVFELTDEGLASLAESLKEWGGLEDGVMCSSSVDFAEEYGVPEDVNVRDWIGKAQLIASGPPPLYFTVEQLEEMLGRLVEGDSDSVIGMLRRNIDAVKQEYEEALKA